MLKRRAWLCAQLLGVLLATSIVGLFRLSQAQTPITLVATGSSLPEPLYVAWSDAYHTQHPQTQLRYLPEGTAESARKILGGVGDLGGGDAPIPENEVRSAAVHVLELPTVLIGIAVVYNLPNTPGELRLSGPLLADIFLGKVRLWNDPAIARLNPTIKLPAQPIQVIHRADGKGANYILSDFLCKTSPDFLARVGRGDSPKWPLGLNATRSQDMAEKVRTTAWSIGYTESNLAQTAQLRMALIKNPAGEFVLPTAKSISAAALASKMLRDFRASLTNAAGKESYPVTSFTWVYVPAKPKDPERGRAVIDYLKWIYADGQSIARDRGYAVLPDELRTEISAALGGVQ